MNKTNKSTTPTMKPVIRIQFRRMLEHGAVMLSNAEYRTECAFHFSAEFGDIAMMRKQDGDIVMSIIIDHKPVELFDYKSDDAGNKFWSRRGGGKHNFWLVSDIYGLGLTYAIEAAKKEAAK